MYGRTAELIRLAKQGDQHSRELLITTHLSYIQSVASRFVGRRLSWQNDDELSVALIAFNEAIDRFALWHGNFLMYARLVIRSRLKDYLRKEARHRHLPLLLVTDDGEVAPAELNAATVAHRDREQAGDLREEIEELDRRLREFGFTLSALVDEAPVHRETKDQCVEAACALAKDPELVRELHAKRRLPLRALQVRTGLSRKVLEKWRRYIIALALIASEPALSGLRGFLRLGEAVPHAASSRTPQ